MLDADVVVAVELGTARHPIDRGLLLLALAEPERDPSSLARLPLGDRNRLLWLAHARWGGDLVATGTCPACGSDQEFPLPVQLPNPTGEEGTFEVATRRYHFRPVNSIDLATAAAAPDEPSAARVLLTRCVTPALGGGPDGEADGLVDAFSDALDQLDPAAAPVLGLSCSECGHGWTSTLDAAEFVWRLLKFRAERILDEVVALAARYGWSEDSILAMSPWRRRAYIDRAAP